MIHPAEAYAIETSIARNTCRHALQKHIAYISHGFLIKTAKAVNRKGIKPVASKVTIDTVP
jgi:hypothetical protein